MPQKNTTERQGAAILEDSATQGDMEAKREIARQLLFGDGVGKDETKAVSLLEECVAHGDADAMMMLAKCCALGRGMEHNAERAEVLLSEAAKKGNDEARFLLQLINEWKRKQYAYWRRLRMCFFKGIEKEENSCLCVFL